MQQFYLGIDVSKGYADFVILDSRKQCVEKNFQLDDTFNGHCRLYERLGQFFKAHPDSVLFAGVESTGGYENNWYNALLKFQATLNIKTARLNPCGVKANSKADLKRNTTDKISAVNVAEYMISHMEKISFEQNDYLAGLRKQWGFIHMLTKQSTQLLNQLESLLYGANPEILSYCRDGVPQWVLKLILSYPTAVKLSRAKASSVSRIPYVPRQRAEQLIADAKQSVASATDEITGQVVSATARQIIDLKKTIAAQVEIMTRKCTVPQIRLLKSFTGISDFSAIGLLLQIQSIERFSTAKKLASFLGLHPVYKISGDGIGGIRMSKAGRKEARQILFMVALTATQRNPLIREIYQERVQKGMEKMAAIGLCMHKIARIIYGMLKHNKPFDPEIDRQNRQRPLGERNTARPDKSRRFQDYDSKAPVSRRQRMKRVEREAKAHSDNVTKSGLNASVPVSMLT